MVASVRRFISDREAARGLVFNSDQWSWVPHGDGFNSDVIRKFLAFTLNLVKGEHHKADAYVESGEERGGRRESPQVFRLY